MSQAPARWTPGQMKAVREAGLVSVVLSLVMAVGWVLLAPEIHGEVAEEGVRVPVAEARQQFGVDAWFALTGAVAGLLAGPVAFLRHRAEPLAALLAAVGWGVFGSVLAWRVGVLIGPGSLDDMPAGATVTVPLDLAALGVLLAWPIAAAAAIVVCIGFLDRDPPPGGRNQVSPAVRSQPSASP